MKLRRHLLVPTLIAGLMTAGAGTPLEAQAPADDLEVILAIDSSESMQPAIDAAKTAAKGFVASMPIRVRIGVETFADDVSVLTPPTTDRAIITDAIDSIETGGDTALYDVVVAASQHFTPSAGEKVLVLLSDGKDEGSVATLDDAVAAVVDVRIEAISLTTNLTDLASLSALGPVTSADDADAMSTAFARIADLLVEVEQTTPTATPPTTTPRTTTVTTTTATTTVASDITTTPAEVTTPTTTSTTASPSTTVAVAPDVPSPPAPTALSAPTEPSANASLWLGAGGVFTGLLLLLLLVIPKGQVSKARLGIDKPRRVSDLGVRTTSAIEQALERLNKRADLGTALVVADISTKPAEFATLVLVGAAVAGSVGLLFGGPLIGLAVALGVCVAVRIYVLRAKANRQAAFADQLPDVLQLVTTALRSGYGITQALESVAEEAEEPARAEFAHVLAETRMGRDLSDSLHALADRMASSDLEWVVSAIDINRETGGNLSEILQQVGVTIREPDGARQVRTLTAEGRLSARILTALPLLLLLWQWRINPDNFALLTEGVGLIALAVAGILILIGAAWVHKIVNSVAL